MSKTTILIVSLILIVGLFMFINNDANISGRAFFGSGESRVQCDDSDNIKKLGGTKEEHAITDSVFWRGNVGIRTRKTTVMGWSEWNRSKVDSCTGDILTEYYCDDSGRATSQTVKCPDGCSNGKCNWPRCSDLDSSAKSQALVNSYTIGLAADDPDSLGVPPRGLNGKKYTDACISETKLREYSCGLDRKVDGKVIDCSKLGNLKCLSSKCQ